MRIPGDFGIVPPVDPDGKPSGSDRAGKGNERGRPDVIEFSSSGRRLSADIASRRTGAAGRSGLDSGARARIERRLASGFYERDEALEVIAEKLLDRFGI